MPRRRVFAATAGTSRPAWVGALANFAEMGTRDYPPLVRRRLMIVNVMAYLIAVFSLIYAALFATALGAQGGSQAGMKSVAANLFYGAPFAIIVYELMVMAPGLGFAILLVLATSLIFAERIYSGSPNAPLWKSGLTGFLFLLGGSIGVFAPEAGDNAFVRVLQIAMACVYVIAAYSFIDLLRDIWQAKLVLYVRKSLSHLSPSKIRQLLRNIQGAG